MRHRKAGRKLGRTSSHRDAMFRNMVTSLLQHGRIETTDAKAKELRRLADHMITLAKRGDLHARRQALSVLKSKAVAHKLFTELRERFLDRNGGYTRILKKGFRVGDCAPVSIIELIPAEHEKAKKAKKKPAKTEEKPKAQPAATKPEKKEEPVVASEAPVEVKEEPTAAETPVEAKEEEQKPAETEPESEPEKA